MSEPRIRKSTLVLILLLVAEFAAIVVLAGNFASVYFVFAGGEPDLTPGAVLSYRVVVGTAIALAVAGVIVGFARRRVGWGIAQVVVLLVVLASAVVFAVPRAGDAPAPAHTPLPSTYVPCYSGGSTCPGG